MDDSDFTAQAHSRPLRWRQWLLIVLLLAFAGGVRAATVYKCVSANGDIAYQSQQCPADADVHVIDLGVAPAYRPSPRYVVAADERVRGTRERHTAPRTARRTEPMSFECRAADGEVFYRHSGCPHSIAAQSTGAHSIGSLNRTGRRGAGSSPGSAAPVPVSATRIARDDACREITRAGAIGRAGHEHDETVSSYDRNLGRDPCR